MRFLSQFGEKFLVAGDFNTHHPLWGDRISCDEGRKLFNALEKTEVGILNQGQSTYFSRQYGSNSAIYLAFVDIPSLALYDWSVEQDSWGSDHFPIYIRFNARSELKNSFRSSRLVNNKTDWELIEKNLESCVDLCAEVINNINIDTQAKYTMFLALITDCIHNANTTIVSKNINSKKKKINTKKPNAAPWWNNKCEKLIRVRKAALLQFKHNSCRENFVKLLKAEHDAKSALNKIKRENF